MTATDRTTTHRRARDTNARHTLVTTTLVAAALLFVSGLVPTTQANADDHTAVPSGQLPLTGTVAVHDPTIFFDEGSGRYVVAATHNSIRSAPTMNGPWTVHGNVPRAEWTFDVPNSSTLWAPHVQKIDDTYYYYYSQSSFGSRNSAIGVKTTQTPTDPASYVDLGHPIIASGSVASGPPPPVTHNAIDPAVLQDQDGDWWIVWGSHWDGIVIQRLDDDMITPIGQMQLIASRVLAPNPIEGPAIFYRNGYYYLLTGWDQCCAGANSTYKIAVGRSTSINGPYIDKNGVPLTQGGGSVILDSRVAEPGVTPDGLYRAPGGPDVYIEDDVYYMVYHAYRPQNTLAIRPMDWHDDWPYFQEPGSEHYDLSDGGFHRLVSETEPSEIEIERVPGPPGFGDAIRLNGPSPVGYVEMPTGILSGLTGDFTIATWVNRAQTGQQWSRIWDFGSGTGSFLFLSPNTGGNPSGTRIDFNQGSGSQFIPTAGNGVPQIPTGWQHVAFTLSGNTGTIWLNGQVYAVNNNVTNRASNLGQTTQNWIGRSQFSADPLLNATIDDFQIFDYALSGAEVASLTDTPGGTVGGGNVAWYRFDEAGGGLVVDSSGQGNDAVAVTGIGVNEDRLHNPIPGDQCLTAVADGANFDVIRSDCDDDDLGQVWRLEREADGFHRLRSWLDGGTHCLQMGNASGTPGTNVIASPCAGGEDLQHWSLDDTGHGFHRPVAKDAGLALEIQNVGGVIGTNVIGGVPRVAPVAGRWPPQQWQLTSVDIELGPDLELELAASTRCVAGNAFVTVTTRNNNEVPVNVDLVSGHGSRTFAGIAPDRFASHAFNTRSSSLEAGSVTVRANAIIDGVEVADEWSVDFDGHSC